MPVKKKDPMYDAALQCVTTTGKATITALQRDLRVGYNRAAQLMELLEAQGIVTPLNSSGSRQVKDGWTQIPADTPAKDIVARAQGRKPAVKKKAASKKKSPAKKKPVTLKTKRKPAPARKKAVKPKSKPKTVTKKKAAPKKKAAAKESIPKYHINGKEWDKDAVITEIFSQMASSTQGLAYICRDDPELPTVKTVFLWMAEEDKNKETGAPTPICDMYTRAKDIQVELMADEINDISDNQVGSPVIVDGKVLIVNGEVIRVIDGPAVQHAKLRSDNRKWTASKLKPRKYGDKLELSSDPERPLSGYSDEELAKKRALLEKQLSTGD